MGSNDRPFGRIAEPAGHGRGSHAILIYTPKIPSTKTTTAIVSATLATFLC